MREQQPPPEPSVEPDPDPADIFGDPDDPVTPDQGDSGSAEVPEPDDAQQ